MAIKMLAIDLDGTLLTDSKTILPGTYKALQEAKAAGIPVIAYGSFLNTVIEFLIIAFAIFMVLKQLNRFLPKPEPAPEPRLCPFCR